MDRAHRITDKLLEETLRKLQITKIDELNILVLDNATPNQRLRAAKKDIDKIVDLFAAIALAFLVASTETINNLSNAAYKLNLDYMAGVLGIVAEGNIAPIKLSPEIGEKLRRETRSAIENMVILGIAPTEMKHRLNRNLESCNSAAKRMARTAATRAENRARLDAMIESEKQGKTIKKRWNTIPDNRVRESHARIDGQTRPLSERFSNGLLYPGEDGAPLSEIVNCRCWLTSV